MTTYTVFANADATDVIDRHLTAEQAMEELLVHDGYAYEIRREEDGRGWRLWRSDGSAYSTRGARHMVETVAFSLEDDEAAATAEIAEYVCRAGWRRLPDCMTDEDYDAMMAQIDADNAARRALNGRA